MAVGLDLCLPVLEIAQVRVQLLPDILVCPDVSMHYHGSLSYYSCCSLSLPSSVSCSPLSTPANVSMNTSSTASGITVQFFCTNGGSISGNAAITCLLNGSWSGSVPYCVDVIASTGESLFPFLNCHCGVLP